MSTDSLTALCNTIAFPIRAAIPSLTWGVGTRAIRERTTTPHLVFLPVSAKTAPAFKVVSGPRTLSTRRWTLDVHVWADDIGEGADRVSAWDVVSDVLDLLERALVAQCSGCYELDGVDVDSDRATLGTGEHVTQTVILDVPVYDAPIASVTVASASGNIGYDASPAVPIE